jgi:peptide chain release factor 1
MGVAEDFLQCTTNRVCYEALIRGGKMSNLLEKLEGIKIRFEEIGQQITDPEVISDMKRYIKLNKEYKNLEPIIEAGNEYKLVVENIQSSKEILNTEKDEEMRDMAKMELEELEDRHAQLEEKIQMLLIPKDPEDDKK